MEKGMYGVANKAEELRGKVAGLYVERNLTLTKELSEDDIKTKMRDLFPDKETFIANHKALMDELFQMMRIKSFGGGQEAVKTMICPWSAG